MTYQETQGHFPSRCLLRFCQNGARASEDSESAEKCQETGWNEEGEGPRSEDCSEGCTRLHLPGVQGEYRDGTFLFLVPFYSLIMSSSWAHRNNWDFIFTQNCPALLGGFLEVVIIQIQGECRLCFSDFNIPRPSLSTVPDAWSENLQATLWEQASQIAAAPRVGGSRGVNAANTEPEGEAQRWVSWANTKQVSTNGPRWRHVSCHTILFLLV